MSIVKTDVVRAYLVEESTQGVPATPVAGSIIVTRDKIEFPSQATSFTEAKELSGTRSITDVMRNLRDAGSIKIPTYLRPSGAAGTAPNEGALLEALLGKKTTTPATSVVYEPAVAKKSMTLWMELEGGATVLFATGLAITEAEFAQEGKGGQPTADFSGSFLRLGWCGSEQLDGALLGGETEIVVHDSTLFSVGARIEVGTSNNAGAGHTVTAIDTATHTLTVSPAVSGAQDDDAAVVPALPTPTPVGQVIGLRPEVKIGGTSKNWKSWKLKVSDPVAVLSDEVTSDPTLADFPVGFVAQAGRKVEATVVAYFRSEDLAELAVNDADVAFAVDFETVAAAGKKVKISCAQCRVSVPELSLGEGAVERTLTIMAKATSAGENEVAFSYK